MFARGDSITLRRSQGVAVQLSNTGQVACICVSAISLMIGSLKRIMVDRFVLFQVIHKFFLMSTK